jgi:tetratricopeptide (TPR) repeat protein
MRTISANELFESLRLAAFAVAALVSAGVLADARRQQRFPLWAAVLWTLGALFYPHIILPLYLIARHFRNHRRKAQTPSAAQKGSSAPAAHTPAPRRLALPLLYLLGVLSLGAIYYYRDAVSVDAHLARANEAKLYGQRQRAIAEYRAALAMEDDPHTHKLLAIELAAERRWTEALAELRAAEQGGEPDALLSFRIATALDALHRPDAASVEYRKFAKGPLCLQPLPDPRCAVAQARAAQSSR